MREIETVSAAATFAAGVSLGKTLTSNAILAFFGDLGAGKTTFIKGVASIFSSDTITSPTFTYLHIYSGKLPLYHFDLYRIRSEKDFIDLGFTEYFQSGVICLIEWAEKIESLLPVNTLRIFLEHAGGDNRKISYRL